MNSIILRGIGVALLRQLPSVFSSSMFNIHYGAIIIRNKMQRGGKSIIYENSNVEGGPINYENSSNI